MSMTSAISDPPRGIVKPAIVGAATMFALACSAIGWLERHTRPAVKPRCVNCPHERPRSVP